MKSTKKIVSIVLVVMMLITCLSATLTAYASTGTLCSYYATNPNGKIGVKKTITVDGSASDWSEDMIIAQGAAWDVANHYKGGHENCVLDTYALFATWDDNNLYVGWQMVNTTDTWAREGDGPLSDGGRVLDVPLILALSVDPNSTSMSNKNTNGGSIWGNNMGLTFDTHVDHLFYMSGKAGLGEPAMFTAVDESGNTNYTTGCHTYKSTGIEYKMAETNICSKIMGLNGSTDPKDVYSDSADWVDYKTFKGSSGTHNTKYDSFYEMKIPLSALGIDANYIETYGIGAMLVATRGESGLDCIPFDDTMLDNATGSYASDPSTSHEKDDVDVITSDLAKIGNLSGSAPITPVTQPTTVQSTTAESTTTQPVQTSNLTVNAASNFFPTATKVYNEDTKQLTVSYDLTSNFDVINAQWTLSYDPTKLAYSSSNTASSVIPNMDNIIINASTPGTVKGSSMNTSLYDFSSGKSFVTLTFDVLGTGTTNVNLDVEYLGFAYYSAADYVNIAYAVDAGVIKDVRNVTGFGSAYITQNTVFDPEVSNKLTVNTTSNFFPSATKVYDSSTNQLTITYKLKSNYDLVDTQWLLTYDATKLSYSSSNKAPKVMPNVSNPLVNLPRTGEVKGICSNISLNDFSTEKDFISIVFDVIGTGTANVNLDMQYLGFGFLESDTYNIAYAVDHSNVVDITDNAGFSDAKYSMRTVFDSSSEYLLGDVDLDGWVSVMDATLIQKQIAELENLTALQKELADYNHDGYIDVKDATEILKFIAEID